MKPIVSCTEGVGAVKKRSQKAPVQKEVAAQASFPASAGNPQKKR
ncbi:hypothetical protein [Phormidium sp. CCY1219]|nr:hypothetical protein [Phormidium sp. CCY1219]